MIWNVDFSSIVPQSNSRIEQNVIPHLSFQGSNWQKEVMRFYRPSITHWIILEVQLRNKVSRKWNGIKRIKMWMGNAVRQTSIRNPQQCLETVAKTLWPLLSDLDYRLIVDQALQSCCTVLLHLNDQVKANIYSMSWKTEQSFPQDTNTIWNKLVVLKTLNC